MGAPPGRRRDAGQRHAGTPGLGTGAQPWTVPGQRWGAPRDPRGGRPLLGRPPVRRDGRGGVPMLGAAQTAVTGPRDANLRCVALARPRGRPARAQGPGECRQRAVGWLIQGCVGHLPAEVWVRTAQSGSGHRSGTGRAGIRTADHIRMAQFPAPLWLPDRRSRHAVARARGRAAASTVPRSPAPPCIDGRRLGTSLEQGLNRGPAAGTAAPTAVVGGAVPRTVISSAGGEPPWHGSSSW